MPTTPKARAGPLPRTAADAPQLVLSRFIPYRLNILASVVSKGFGASYARYSSEFGIGVAEWRVISFLGERLGTSAAKDGMTARDIGARTRMQKVRVSRAIAALEAAGLVLRRVNPRDRRESFLFLSARGRQIFRTIAPIALQYQNALIEGLSPADLAALDRLIEHLQSRAASLRAAAAVDPDARAG